MNCDDLFVCSYKNKLLFFNRKELSYKAKDRYKNVGGKENSAEYYLANIEILQESAKNEYRNLFEEEKQLKREYKTNKYGNMTEDKKKNRNIKEVIKQKKIKYYFFA